MKEIKEDQRILYSHAESAGIDEALEKVETALNFLWADCTITLNDKVAGDYDYEELLGALLSAKGGLKEAIEIRSELERKNEETN